jgi:hypothetical protein
MFLPRGDNELEDELSELKYSPLARVDFEKIVSCCPSAGKTKILTMLEKTESNKPSEYKTDIISNFFIRWQVL